MRRALVVTRASLHQSGGMEKYVRSLAEAYGLKQPAHVACADGIFIFFKGKCRILHQYPHSIAASKSAIRLAFINLHCLFFLKKRSHLYRNILVFGHTFILPSFLLRIPSTKTCYFGLGYEFLDTFEWEGLKTRVFKFVHRMLFRLYKRRMGTFAVIENSQKHKLLDGTVPSCANIVALPNFIDLKTSVPIWKNSLKSNKVIFLSIGRDCVSKNREKLLADWAKFYDIVSSLGVEVELRLLCPKASKTLETLAQRYSDKNVWLLEGLSFDEINQERERALVDISYSSQGIPLLSTLESMCFGMVPLVDNDHGGFYTDRNSLSFSKVLHRFRTQNFNIQDLQAKIAKIVAKRAIDQFRKDVTRLFL